MKKFFAKIKNWWAAHKPSKRRLIQLYAALLYNANIKGFFTGNIYTGNSKLACLPGLNCYSCPGAVGACPLGSLQNALAASDTRLPAYVFGTIILFGLLLGRTICGFLCPIGLGQELLYKIKTPKMKKSKYTRLLSYLKYFVLAVFVIVLPLAFAEGGAVPAFCKYICPAGTFEGALGLLINPENADQFAQLNILFTWKMSVLIVLVVASIFIFRVFCRFLCPLGALYGFFCKVAMLGVKLDKNKCTDCGLCVAACKMDIKNVGDHECIHCGACIDVCPTKAISWKGSKLFIKENAIDAPAPMVEKPLTAFLKTNGESVAETETATTAAETVGMVENVENVGQVETALTAKQKEKRRNKIMEGTAWGVALTVLAGALVYYNFIEKDDASVNTNSIIGKECPDFTLDLLVGNGEFTLSEARGKVVVLNFWHVDCKSCKDEMPHFNELQNNYPDSVEVVAIHRYDYELRRGKNHVRDTWGNYAVTFAVDEPVSWQIGSDEALETPQTLFTSFGGGQAWPQTVIIDETGVIREYRAGVYTYEQLEYKINELLND